MSIREGISEGMSIGMSIHLKRYFATLRDKRLNTSKEKWHMLHVFYRHQSGSYEQHSKRHITMIKEQLRAAYYDRVALMTLFGEKLSKIPNFPVELAHYIALFLHPRPECAYFIVKIRSNPFKCGFSERKTWNKITKVEIIELFINISKANLWSLFELKNNYITVQTLNFQENGPTKRTTLFRGRLTDGIGNLEDTFITEDSAVLLVFISDNPIMPYGITGELKEYPDMLCRMRKYTVDDHLQARTEALRSNMSLAENLKDRLMEKLSMIYHRITYHWNGKWSNLKMLTSFGILLCFLFTALEIMFDMMAVDLIPFLIPLITICFILFVSVPNDIFEE